MQLPSLMTLSSHLPFLTPGLPSLHVLYIVGFTLFLPLLLTTLLYTTFMHIHLPLILHPLPITLSTVWLLPLIFSPSHLPLFRSPLSQWITSHFTYHPSNTWSLTYPVVLTPFLPPTCISALPFHCFALFLHSCMMNFLLLFIPTPIPHPPTQLLYNFTLVPSNSLHPLLGPLDSMMD